MIPLITPHKVASLLHWISAFLILAMLLLGWSFEEQPPATKSTLLLYHMLGGGLILVLSVIRIGFVHKYRVFEQSRTLWKVMTKQLVQVSLYTLLIAVPFSGVVALSSTEMSLALIDDTSVQDLIPYLDNLPLGIKQGIHQWLVNALALCVLIHISAALLQHLVTKNYHRDNLNA